MYINLTRHGKMNWKLPEHGMKDPLMVILFTNGP